MKRLTQEEFINKCKSILGDTYTYEKTKYVNNRTKITITNKYGKDIQCYPSNIKKLKGKKDKYDTDSFIRRAKQIYGNKYTYEKTNCSNSHEKVIITCPEHGDFEKTAYAFLNGQECPICGNRYSNEKFAKIAENVHEKKYNYSEVNYINNNTKVCIICPEHGKFWQTPNSHLRGSGCPLCYRKETREKECTKFLDKCKKLYDGKYDYSQTEYINSNSKIPIICSEHGIFWKSAIKHSMGQACPICSKIKQSEALRLTTDDFIRMAIEKHGNKYDYSKVEYTKWNEKVAIICKKHGLFFQTPHSHISGGSGCPKCSESHAELDIEKYLKNNNIEYETQKTFSWLKMKKNLFIDFYIPSKNVGIEFQGGQHFVPVKYGNNSNADLILEKTQKRDKQKHELCEKNGVKLLYIIPQKYKENLYGFYNKEKVFNNIEELLSYINEK